MRDRSRNIVSVSLAVAGLLSAGGVVAAGGGRGSPATSPTTLDLTQSDEPSSTVLDLVHGSVGMTMAADASGALHVAASSMVDASGAYHAVYALCTDACAQATSWSGVVLAEISLGHVPTIALTEDGRPRLAYNVATGSAPGLHYLECDSACLTADSWHDVWLADTQSIQPFPRPRLPFAVSPSGGAAYAYDDGTGLQLLSCTSACADGASWKRTQIAGPFIVPESLAFGPDDDLQVVARQRQLDTETLMLLACATDCASAGSWGGVGNMWSAHGEIQAQLARTESGGSRIVLYADDPSTPAPERILGYLACDADCGLASRWGRPLLPPIAPGAADIGYAVALDAADGTILAHTSDSASAVTGCAVDCTTPAGRWVTVPGLTTEDLDAAYPITLPASCERAGWSIYSGPALALVDARPITAVTASATAYGGPCENGTTIDTVSFVRFGP